MSHASSTSLDGYDFVDFGASERSYNDIAVVQLGGRKGLGVDVDPRKVTQMRELGYDCMAGDITRLGMARQAVRFVTMSHVLEHLPDLQSVSLAIRQAEQVATDFLLIQGPYFDADDALAKRGFKFYWSDWHGHTCHLTTHQLVDVLRELGLRDYVLTAHGRVLGSDDPCIHPLCSPRDQHAYRAGVHPAKPEVAFEPPHFHKPVYREFVCLVRLRDFAGWRRILHARGDGTWLDGTVGTSSAYRWQQLSRHWPVVGRRWVNRLRRLWSL